jgi:hypothetical protein
MTAERLNELKEMAAKLLETAQGLSEKPGFWATATWYGQSRSAPASLLCAAMREALLVSDPIVTSSSGFTPVDSPFSL